MLHFLGYHLQSYIFTEDYPPSLHNSVVLHLVETTMMMRHQILYPMMCYIHWWHHHTSTLHIHCHIQ